MSVAFGIIYAPQSKGSIYLCVNDLELISKTCELEDFNNQLDYFFKH